MVVHHYPAMKAIFCIASCANACFYSFTTLLNHHFNHMLFQIFLTLVSSFGNRTVLLALGITMGLDKVPGSNACIYRAVLC